MHRWCPAHFLNQKLQEKCVIIKATCLVSRNLILSLLSIRHLCDSKSLVPYVEILLSIKCN